MHQLSRRVFLASSSALACACALPACSAVSKGRFPDLQTPAYNEVELSPSPLLTQRDYQHNLYMSIEDDRLLKPFRVRGGLPAPGEDMGGWYDASDDFHIDPNDWSTANWHGYIPGHSFGQYMSGLSRIYAATGHAGTKAKIESLVEKFSESITPAFFDDYNLPAYTYDKIVVGLIDAYRYADVATAKPALAKATEAVLPFLPEKALTREERRALPYTREAQIWDEPYVLPEYLFQAWKLGMGEQYKDLALRFLQNEALFDPLAEGISPLTGKHAYSHVTALSSAIEAYYVTGEDKYLKAAINGFAFIQKQSYATGGWGPNEELLAADDTDTLRTMLTDTHRTFETPCGAFAHFKITRSLLSLTRDSLYGDSMERILYNTILGATPTRTDGDTFYYSDYNMEAKKFLRGEAWPCCSGTFVQLTSDYGISAYLTDEDGIYVNLYVPSTATLTVKDQPVRLSQITQYPLTDAIRLRVEPQKPGRFDVSLRIPAWAGPNTGISINGESYAGEIKPGSFLRLTRQWGGDDVIDITFDMPIRLEALNDKHSDLVAVMTGPLVLFPIAAPETPFSRDVWLSASRQDTNTWVIHAPSGDIFLKPFMSIKDETYRLYNPVAA